MKKKQDPLMLVIYGLIVVFVLYFAAAIGTAMDLSANKDTGELDFNVLGSSLESTVVNTDLVMSHITDVSSYGFKIPIMTAFGVGIYVLLKFTTKKRLHRKGVEHGSARWATEKEAKKLADNPPKILPYEDFTDENGKKHRVNFSVKESEKNFTVTYNKLSKKYPLGASENAEKICADFKIPQKTAKKIAENANKKVRKMFETDNNIILTQDVRMSLNTRQHRENLNVLVIGGSGSGKSRFYVKPNLMQLNTSYVVTDPKGELLRSCGRLMQKAGYEIRVFNLIDMSHSNNYNPFNYVYDVHGEVNKTYVLKMINCLMKNTKQEGSSGGDQFWDDATKALLSAISFYLLEKADPKDRNFGMVMKVMKLAEISEQDENAKSKLDEMMEELESENPFSMAVTYYKDFKKAPAETAKSILISAAVRLQAFNLPEVADLTFTDNISLNTMGDKKTALFVIIPSSDATFNFLAAMMYTQLFDTLYDTANFKYGGRLPVHVRCLLDEFANIGTIPDFDKLLATMRSMEISANIIIQNLAQLKKMYDKSWEILTGNCDSLLFLGGQEASTLEAISKSLGKETIDVVSQNRTRGHKSNSSSENNSIMGRELMTTDELKTMKPQNCVLIVRAFYPFFCTKFNIEKHPNYKYLEDSNKAFAYEIDNLHTLTSPDNEAAMSEEITEKDRVDIPTIDEEEDKMTAEKEIPTEKINEDLSVKDEFSGVQEEEKSPSEKLFVMGDMEDVPLPTDGLKPLLLEEEAPITEEDYINAVENYEDDVDEMF